jgi:hypothetical protein
MATRARIAMQVRSGKYVSSYHHWDGYPAGLGYNLIKNYDDDNKTLEAINLGDASHWGSKVYPDTESHSFDNAEEDVNVYYGRDRGEDNVGFRMHDTLEELLDTYADAGEEYLYVRQNGKWGMLSRYEGETLIEDAEDDIIVARAAAITAYKKRMAA